MLLCFGDITAAWRLLDMAVIANRYLDEGKTDPYYAREVVEIPDEAF
ncbi:MAG: hypothetical protein JRI90_18815 [Deltaproteobacteria bacterium]|nr:hypothetical protein [Deltaproteobacteria bacterium]